MTRRDAIRAMMVFAALAYENKGVLAQQEDAKVQSFAYTAVQGNLESFTYLMDISNLKSIRFRWKNEVREVSMQEMWDALK